MKIYMAPSFREVLGYQERQAIRQSQTKKEIKNKPIIAGVERVTEELSLVIVKASNLGNLTYESEDRH